MTIGCQMCNSTAAAIEASISQVPSVTKLQICYKCNKQLNAAFYTKKLQQRIEEYSRGQVNAYQGSTTLEEKVQNIWENTSFVSDCAEEIKKFIAYMNNYQQ